MHPDQSRQKIIPPGASPARFVSREVQVLDEAANWFKIFCERQVRLSGSDELRFLGVPLTARGSLVGKAGTLSVPKTLAAVTVELCNGAGVTLEPANYLDECANLFKRCDIRNVLEIGPSRRGIVHGLWDLGFRHRADLTMSACDLHLGPPERQELLSRRIRTFECSAGHLPNVISPRSMDLILAAGVFTAGGFYSAGSDALHGLSRYEAVEESCRESMERLSTLLSGNPHAMIVISSLGGLIAVRRESLVSLRAEFWREPPSAARHSELEHLHPSLRPNNPGRFDRARERVAGATDLAVLKLTN